jgi:hypothetical protein
MDDYGEEGGRGGHGGRRRGGGMNQIDDSYMPEKGGERGGRGGGGGSGRGGGRGGSGPKMAFNRVVPKFLQQYSSMLERPKYNTEEGDDFFPKKAW